MRLTIIITAMAEGGMERFAATLCNTLASQNREALLCTLHELSPGASSQWLDPQVPVRVLNRRARWGAFRLWRLCRECPDDPILALGLEIAVVLMWLKRLRLIHNPVFYRESTDVKSHLTLRWKNRLKNMIPGLDGILVQSGAVEKDLREMSLAFPPVLRVPNPCVWLSASSPGFTLRSSDLQAPQLLCVARLEKIKGHDRLLDAMPGVLEYFPAATLRLLGSGTREEALRERVQQMGLEAQVTFCGFQSDPRPFFQKTDVVLLASDYEGFPNVIGEALACGCRLVCANAPGGIQEILGQVGLGEFGISVSDFSKELPEMLARVVRTKESIWEGARERMAALCAPVAVAELVWDFCKSPSTATGESI